ncbi:MAG TPA: SDR family NAD(P)-dependent oxidoreductase [Candidatus Kryptonia bacterium]|nr:SDR family NAD(P)-dependent oxidoreductase [Candidatus Kryptonia bacterium]
MDLSLHGKVALVTGAARGIGRAITLELARAGATLAVGDVHLAKYRGERYYRLSRRISGSDEDVPTAEAATQLGARAMAVEFDVADENQVQQAVARIGDELGAIDVLVNNAGIVNNMAPIATMAREAWDRELAVNLSGAFSCIQACVPRMAERGWGRVINISSVAAETPDARQPAYAASKAGVLALTKTVAKEYGGRGVTCNAVLPGLIATPLVMSMPDALRAAMVRNVPAGRLGATAEIAAVVAFLAGPAASFVNGAAIPVDGGWLTGPPFA